MEHFHRMDPYSQALIFESGKGSMRTNVFVPLKLWGCGLCVSRALDLEETRKCCTSPPPSLVIQVKAPTTGISYPFASGQLQT